jgi:hypothetical protein
MAPEVYQSLDQIGQLRYEQVGHLAQAGMKLDHTPNILMLRPNTINPYLGPENMGPNSPELIGVNPQELSTQEQFMSQHIDHYLTRVLNRAPHEFAGKTIGMAVPFVGWGHLIQAAGLAQKLTRVGHFNVVIGDIVESLPKDRAYPYQMIQKFLKVHQTGEHVHEFLTGIRQWDPNEPFGENFNRQVASYIFQIALSGGGIDKSEAGLSKLSASLAGRFKENPAIVSALFKLINGIDSYATERQLAQGVSEWKKIFGFSALLSTHTAPIRSGVFIPKSERLPSMACIPDDGYGLDPGADPDDLIANYQGLIAFAPTPLEGKNSGNVYTYANRTIVDTVIDLLNPNANATEMGTLSSSITPEAFIAKWQHPTRNILLSSSGTGSNLGEVTSQVEEYYQALISGRDLRGYNLQVFIGNNLNAAPQRLKDLMATVKSEGIKGIEFILTEDQNSTAFLKDEYTKSAHVQIRSPGENALDNGNMGCAAINTFINAPHERSNLYHMMLKGAAFPAVYPRSSYEGWQEYFAKIPEDRRPTHNMELLVEPPEDFVSYLDQISGRRIDGDSVTFDQNSLIQDVATNGFINSDPNAQLHAMLILYQLLINYEDGLADVSQQQLGRIHSYMTHVRAISKQEREEKLKEAGYVASYTPPV